MCGVSQAGLPLRLRKFPSGVIVVQGSQFSDTQLCKNIEQLLQQKSQGGAAPGSLPTTDALPTPPGGSSNSFVAGLGPALSAADVSAALVLPMTLAKEALLVAESSGVLCRDDGPEGLRFFRNFFREAQPVAF
jgi:ESCRT-II complex subunit VPS36